MGDYIVWKDLGVGTRLLMNQLHYGGLLFMILAYTYKIHQLLKKPVALEGTPPRGNHSDGIKYAYMTLAMPWELESQAKNIFRYFEFAIFHLAMAIGIGFAFMVPIAHEFMKNPVIAGLCKLFFGLGFLIGLSRLARRIFVAEMRIISTPDDYFCLILLTLWMFSGWFTAPLVSALMESDSQETPRISCRECFG